MLHLLALAAPLSASQETAPAPYLVLSAVPADDPYAAAAGALVEGHRARIETFDPADLEPLRAVLREIEPANVAIVLRPEQLDFDLARRFLELSTEVDDDPFVDFAFGYITGRTAEDAERLARAGLKRSPTRGKPKIASIAGGVDASRSFQRPVTVGDGALASTAYHCAGEEAFPDDGRDTKFVAQTLKRLRRKVDALTFIGHGFPDGVVGGPKAADLGRADLSGAVVLNVACYTGVTSRWYETDWRAGVENERIVAPEDSFALALLGAGVTGYTAYLCPRPAGPELDCDRAALIADGLSLGEARRRDYDKTVLGFLGFGEERLALEAVADGVAARPVNDAVRDLMLEGATGGVLFGDPACVPFQAREGGGPVVVESAAVADGIAVRATVPAAALFVHCNDPTAQMDGSMAMKVHARVPLGDVRVADVAVSGLRVGKSEPETRVLWAVEEDRGERYLQLKVNFPRSREVRGDLELEVHVRAAAEGEEGALRGGEIVPPRKRQASSGTAGKPDSVEVTDAMRASAEAREVGSEALDAALAASAALLSAGQTGAQPTEAVARLATFGDEGFRAACVLLEHGRSHYRSHELFDATWEPGAEATLLELADGPPLPNFASWSVLQSLGACDTDGVRTYLLERLADEEDAGLFMSASQGLARLGEERAIAPIRDRLLEAREGWSGVAPHMIAALVDLDARDALAAIAESDDEALADRARAALEHLGRK